jgi:hypothetical protein
MFAGKGAACAAADSVFFGSAAELLKSLAMDLKPFPHGGWQSRITGLNGMADLSGSRLCWGFRGPSWVGAGPEIVWNDGDTTCNPWKT